MFSQLLTPLLDLSISNHLLAASLLLLVATILLSPNTENFIGKRFYLFILAAAVTHATLFASKASWIPINSVIFSNQILLLAIGITLFQLSASIHSAKRLIKWLSAAQVTIYVITTLVSLIDLVLPSTYIINMLTAGNPELFPVANLVALLLSFFLSEQLYRNALPESKVVSRPFFTCIWLWLILELYNSGYMLTSQNSNMLLHFGTGYLGLAIALIGLVGSSRSSFEQKFSLSANETIYASSIKLSSIALITMALLGVLASYSDTTLTDSVQLIAVVLWLAAIFILIFSPSHRSKLRVLINKNLFGNKYDYRNIWLTLISRLSSPESSKNFYAVSLSAMGEIFAADGGALWIKNSNNELKLVETNNLKRGPFESFSISDKFVEHMQEKNWIYTVSGTNDAAALQYNHYLPEELGELPGLWLAGPLSISGELVGFFVLIKTNPDSSMIWEDLDIAKSAGTQIASYIVRHQSAESLAESKQFDAYNQLTAFIMHDLKNLIAQQALVVKNANKHKENPAFVEDMIRTIDNSVQRMNGLLNRLKRNDQTSAHKTVDLKHLLLDAIRKSTDRHPIPTLRAHDFNISIRADPEQMTMVIAHLIRNAQDATDSQGFIDIDVAELEDNMIRITIEDNGTGMSEAFVSDKLFKPFESTKSSMGMGIGAFQARDFVRSMGGEIRVLSEENVGTLVVISLPMA